MKNILILFFALCSLLSYAQINKEVNFEKIDGKYHLKITTTIDGEKTVFEKTYDSIEEMKTDADLEGLKLHIFDKDSDAIFFSDDDLEIEKNVNVFIKEGDVEAEDLHEFKFKTNGDSTEIHQIKVWVDDEGNKRIIKDGEEIEIDTWTDNDDHVFEIKEGDAHIIIKSGDEISEFISEDSNSFDVNVKVKRIENKDGEKVIIYKTGDNEDGSEKQIVVKIVEEISIHLEDIDNNEFEDLLEGNSKSLKIDEINYFPNPNSGIFTLAFKTDNKPTEVKVMGIDGKLVYSESINEFEGTYNNEIDLSNEKKGIYLLQILQGKRAYNKKIVIE